MDVLKDKFNSIKSFDSEINSDLYVVDGQIFYLNNMLKYPETSYAPDTGTDFDNCV